MGVTIICEMTKISSDILAIIQIIIDMIVRMTKVSQEYKSAKLLHEGFFRHLAINCTRKGHCLNCINNFFFFLHHEERYNVTIWTIPIGVTFHFLNRFWPQWYEPKHLDKTKHTN